MSFNTSLSRLSSATNRFSFAFSCSSSFNRFAWSTCRPPYSFAPAEVRLLHNLPFLARLRRRLPVRYRHFNLSQQVRYLLRLIPLASGHLSSLFQCLSYSL